MYECGVEDEPFCHQLHSCQACSAYPHCHWQYNGACKSVANLSVEEQQVMYNYFFIKTNTVNKN